METAARTIAGRYRLVERLGSGGMGIVWRAEDTVLGRSVALKEVTFPPGLPEADREVLRERTRREARAAAQLNHESAVTVHDVAEEDGTPFLVMELVPARTLAEVIASDGPLSPRRTAEVGLAVLGALEAAHERGIVHRDVKPSNVLLRDDGRVVLTDFGIATFTGDPSITSTGLLLGSPSYISPERAQGMQPGPPSDLWSLGATLFTAVEGRAPYDQGEVLPTLNAVITGQHKPFAAAGPLAPLLDGLLEKDPQRRYAVPQARQALERVLASHEDTTTQVAPPSAGQSESSRTQVLSLGAIAQEVAAAPAGPQPPAPVPLRAGPSPRARRRWLPVTGAAAALALLVGAAVLLGTTRSSGDGSGAGRSTQQRPSGASSPAGTRTVGGGGSSSAGAGLPTGWVRHRQGDWSIGVPPSYRAGEFAGFPQYKDGATSRTLRVSFTAPGAGKADALQDRRDQAAAFRESHEGYHEIAITAPDYRGLEAADWEFTYSAAGRVLHVINRVFVIDGRGYSLYFQTRGSDDWSDARKDFDVMAASFTA